MGAAVFWVFAVVPLFAALATSQSTIAPTTAAANATHVTALLSTTTAMASLTTTAEPFLPSGLPNVTCPFSRWQGNPRYCYECRWCPFRASTCCEMEDEYDTLQSVNVSGTDYWDCFITIVHFQQCGRCDPNSRQYIQNKQLPYVWSPFNVSIRPCRQACEYIYNRCSKSTTLSGQVVTGTMTVDEFCAGSPEINTPDTPCYNSGGTLSAALGWSMVIAAVFAWLA